MTESDFKCGVCGQEHNELPMVLAYQRPAEFFAVPINEREGRIKISSDLCSIDDSVFIVRGVLELPVLDEPLPFEWGVWAIIEKQAFMRYVELWDSDQADDEPLFDGKLSGGVQAYPKSDLLDVKVRLRSGNKRPLFFVESQQHQLGIDQRIGISKNQAHGFIEQAMPHLFNNMT